MRKAVLISAVALPVALGTLLYSPGTDTPEAQVRRALAQAVEAAEERDLGALMDLVSDRFQARGIDRDTLKGLVFQQLRSTAWRRVMLTSTTVDLKEDNTTALVTTDAVFVGGDAVESVDDLIRDAARGRVRADMYAFEVQLAREEDAWRVVKARWRPKRLTSHADTSI